MTMRTPREDSTSELFDHTMAETLTRSLCWGVIGTSLFGAMSWAWFTPGEPVRAVSTVLAGGVGALCLWWLRCGWVFLAARSLLWLIWLVMALGGIINGGVEAPGLTASVVLASFAALLFGLREALAMCGATAVLCFSLAAHERAGQPGFVPPPETRALVYVVLSVAAAILFARTAAILRGSAAAAREEAARRTHSEAALRKEEARLKLVLESGRHGLWDWQVRENRVERSPLLARVLGYRPEDISADPAGVSGLIHPDDLPVYECLLGTIKHPGKDDFSAEVRLRTSEGGWRWFAIVGRVMERGPDGIATHALGTHTDITALKSAEAALRQLNHELEQRVAARTAELQSRTEEAERLADDLRRSRQRVDRTAANLQQVNANLFTANQELEAFSYSVSHDLRAPLRNMTGFLELLSKRTGGQIDAEAQRFVATVSKEALRMGLLIDDLLTFARIGRTEMKFGPVNLDELFAEVRGDLHTEIGDRVIEWKWSALPLVSGDRTLLHQVVANLLGNAVKFTRNRPVASIEIGATVVRPGDATVTAFVRDNGVGFNPLYIDKLFGVFQRLHNQRDFEGTGIGLANVKRIVTRHGGRVWAEGSVDKGATFYFTLPVFTPP